MAIKVGSKVKLLSGLPDVGTVILLGVDNRGNSGAFVNFSIWPHSTGWGLGACVPPLGEGGFYPFVALIEVNPDSEAKS